MAAAATARTLARRLAASQQALLKPAGSRAVCGGGVGTRCAAAGGPAAAPTAAPTAEAATGHAHGSYNDYLHAEHMYGIYEMRNRKLKFAALGLGMWALGGSLTVFAVMFQQSKLVA